MIKSDMVKRVIANMQEFDMSNLFYPNPLIEEMAEAAKGIYEAQPQKTLRERQYKDQPLMIKPDYSGDFLKKLEQDPIEGKPVVDAASNENLLDFSMPSEMLKHQEKPHPRVILDDFYDMNRPGDQAGGEDLKDYWRRDWENQDSPEMSEDKWLRMWTRPGESNVHQARNITASLINPKDQRVGRVILGFILGAVPNVRIGMVLEKFRDSRIHGVKTLDTKGVTCIKRSRGSSPAVGRWVFDTGGSGPEVTVKGRTFKKPYTTVIEVIPNGSIRNPLKLEANVSCTCPSWLFWGAQYHAAVGGYIYGKVIPVFAPPRKRDREGSFIACKHILKAIDTMVTGGLFKIKLMPAEKRKQLKEKRSPRKLKFDTSWTGEVIKVPQDLIGIGKRPKMQQIVGAWDSETVGNRRKILDGLTDEDELTFLAFRFPDSAIIIGERLKELPKTPGVKKSLKKVEGLSGDEGPAKELAIPVELKQFDTPEAQVPIKDLDQKMDSVKTEIISKITDPDFLAYTAYKYSQDDKVLSEVEYRLRKMFYKSEDPEEKKKADYWLRTILGGPLSE